jgi:hypothetical protein
VRITFLRPALTTALIVASAGILAGGLALRPAFAVGGTAIVGPFTITHCSKSSACKIYSNAGVGAGAQGTNTNASSSGAGLLGSATQSGTGVAGTSSAGVGVLGTSTSSVGVRGASSLGIGVSGITSSSTSTAAGVQGQNNASTIAVRANGYGGPLFVGNSSSSIDVFTVANDGTTMMAGGASVPGASGSDAFVAGTSASYRGVLGVGNYGAVGIGYGSGPFGVLGFNDGNGTAITAQDLTGSGLLMTGFDSSNTLKFEVADDGTVYAHNFVVAFDTPRGQKVSNYATMSSTQNVEDFGEAQLTGGQTYVSLKGAFAGEIDARYAYMVFITPEGDTRGLYVTQKTPAGFIVRESQGGRSDATFSYRIVAKPFGATEAGMRPSIAPPYRARLHPMVKLNHVPKTSQ